MYECRVNKAACGCDDMFLLSAMRSSSRELQGCAFNLLCNWQLQKYLSIQLSLPKNNWKATGLGFFVQEEVGQGDKCVLQARNAAQSCQACHGFPVIWIFSSSLPQFRATLATSSYEGGRAGWWLQHQPRIQVIQAEPLILLLSFCVISVSLQL